MAKRSGKASRFLVWVLMGFLLVGLAGFGVSSFTGGASVVGRVGDETITAQDYARALNNEMRALTEESGTAVSMRDMQAMGLDGQVLARLIAQATLANEADAAGVSVGDAEVARQIQAIPAFQGPTGGFDRQAYEFYLDRTGLTPAEFEESVRDDAARALLQQAVVGGVTPPETLVDTLVAYQTETRNATLARVDAAALETEIPEPTEEDLAAFYEAEGDAFVRPETRVVTYAWVTPEAMLPSVEIDEAVVRDLYEERRDEFVQPERRLLERLVFLSETDAEAAVADMAAGEASFDDLVAARDLTLDDVDLGEVAREDLEPGAREAVFSDDTSEIIGPVEIDLGYAVYRVNAVLDATEVAFEDAAADLAEELSLAAARRAVDDAREDYEDLLASGATLEELAAETVMELGTLDYAEGAEAPILGYDAVRVAIEATEPGDFPEIIELSDGGLAALRVDRIDPPVLPPLDEVTEEVAAAWRARALRDAVAARAEDIVAGLDDGGLEATELELRTETGLRRRDVVPGAPPTLVAQLFQLDADGAVQVVPGPDAAWILRRDAVVPGARDAADAAILSQLIGQQLAQSYAGDLFEAFGQAAQAEEPPTLNQGTVAAVHATFP